MSLTTRDIEHARQRVDAMTPPQLLTRLNRITKPEKLHAFSAAVAEHLEVCNSEREVRRYHHVLVRIDERRDSNTLDLEYYLGRFQVGQQSHAFRRPSLDRSSRRPSKPTVKKVIARQSVIQLPKVKKKVSRRNLGI